MPDVSVCTWLGPHNGYCTNTISGGDTFVPTPVWENLVTESVIVPADSWIKIKAFVQNICHQNKANCPNGVGSWGSLVKRIDGHRKGAL